jgi:hypothetical protein
VLPLLDELLDEELELLELVPDDEALELLLDEELELLDDDPLSPPLLAEEDALLDPALLPDDELSPPVLEPATSTAWHSPFSQVWPEAQSAFTEHCAPLVVVPWCPASVPCGAEVAPQPATSAAPVKARSRVR